MKKLLTLIALLYCFAAQAQYDTLYTRGGNYMLVPADAEISSPTSPASPVKGIFTDIMIALIAAGLGIYLNSIKRGVNKIGGKVDLLSDRVDKLDESVKAQALTVMDISLCNNVMSRIDFKIQQSLEYLEKDDIAISSFIMKMGQGAKEFIQWAIHTKLKVSEEEIRGRYELMNMEIRDLLVKVPANFSQKVRPFLKQISIHHIDRVVSIATDELYNSKLDRFFTLTEQTVNETLSVIIKTRIENNLTK